MVESATNPGQRRTKETRDSAIPILLNAHGGRMYRLGLRFCGNHADAQDLVQETFLQAYRKWDQFKGDAAVATWLYTIASRVCQRMHRRRSGQPHVMESLEELLPFGEPRVARLPGPGDDPAVEAQRQDLRECAEEAIAALPADFRIPLILKDVIDLSVKEISTILGVKSDTVKTRLHRARLRVRRELEAERPKSPAGEPAYDRQVCLDLLQSKMDALDRGAEFPVAQDVVCERCRHLFAELDLGRDLCRDLGRGDLPGDVREAVLARLRQP